jgi:hypothetical protein
MNVEWLAKLGLDQLKLPPLKAGAHKDPSDGLCAMEMVAFIERLPHSDRPPCTSPVVASVMICINDTLGDGRRNTLLPWLPRVVGTVAPEFERVRAYAVLQDVFDLVVGLHTPRILDKHLHDRETGRRTAFPPWDYAEPLSEAVANIHRLGYELARYLREALIASEPADVAGNAMLAISALKRLDDRGARFAREPVYAQPMSDVAVNDGAVDDTEVTMRVRDYTPNFDTVRFDILERVLAIGPKGKGWSRGDICVMGAVRQIAADLA